MLHVHRSDRADGLAEALRGLLAEPPADPFAPEVVCVPTRGMERWLTQRLAAVYGICANIEFPFPRRLTGAAVATASGIDPDTDPWLPERLVWPLLQLVETEPWLQDLPAQRRFGILRHPATPFGRYALPRPGLGCGRTLGGDRAGRAWGAPRGGATGFPAPGPPRGRRGGA